MKAFLIFLFAVPIGLGILAANLLGYRRLYQAVDLSDDLETILDRLSTKYGKVDYRFSKRTWSGIMVDKDGVAVIDEKFRYSTSSADVARQLIHLGLSGLWEDHEKLIRWRLKCVKLGYIIPPLTLMGVVFATLVGRVPAMWGVVILGGALAGCVAFLWFSRAVEREAASQMATLLERTRILPRISEEENLIDCIYAWTWVSLMPGIAISFLMKKRFDEDLNRENR